MERIAKFITGVVACAVFGAAAYLGLHTADAQTGGGYPSKPRFADVGVGRNAPSPGIAGGAAVALQPANTSAAGFIQLADTTTGSGLLCISDSATGCNASGVAHDVTLSSGAGLDVFTGGTNPVRINGNTVASTLFCTTACSAANLIVGQSAIIVKTTATSRASTTTLAMDPDLQFTAIAAGTYAVQASITFTAGAGGFKYEIMPNNCSGSTSGGLVGTSQTATTTVQNVGINPQTFAGTGDTATLEGIQSSINVIYGVCWAQNSSSVANTNVLGLQNYIEITRIN
jgi:hypothetical protein